MKCMMDLFWMLITLDQTIIHKTQSKYAIIFRNTSTQRKVRYLGKFQQSQEHMTLSMKFNTTICNLIVEGEGGLIGGLDEQLKVYNMVEC